MPQRFTPCAIDGAGEARTATLACDAWRTKRHRGGQDFRGTGADAGNRPHHYDRIAATILPLGGLEFQRCRGRLTASIAGNHFWRRRDGSSVARRIAVCEPNRADYARGPSPAYLGGAQSRLSSGNPSFRPYGRVGLARTST